MRGDTEKEEWDNDKNFPKLTTSKSNATQSSTEIASSI